MGVLAVFGIENDGLELAVNLLLLFLVVIWFALVYWTFADARRRIADPLLVGCASAASLFPFVGTVVYLIVRPPEYLDDVRERELEIAAAEARLASLEHIHCQYCGFEVEKDFLRCPPARAVQRVRPAARPALEDLPLLRGRGRPGGAGAAPAPHPAHRRRVGLVRAPERPPGGPRRPPARAGRRAPGGRRAARGGRAAAHGTRLARAPAFRVGRAGSG